VGFAKLRRPLIAQALEDAGRIPLAVVALARHLVTRDVVRPSLSLFRAADLRAVVGKQSRYEIVIANLETETQPVALELAFRSPAASRGRALHGRFVTSLRLSPRASLSITVLYDWRGEPIFVVDGVRHASDHAARGPCPPAGRMFVDASLRRLHGEVLERLTIVQRLDPCVSSA
jgi:hypothetical protein